MVLASSREPTTTIETSETSTLCVETRQMSVLATEEMSAVET